MCLISTNINYDNLLRTDSKLFLEKNEYIFLTDTEVNIEKMEYSF